MENGENKEKMGKGGFEEEDTGRQVQPAKPSANTLLPAHTDSHKRILLLVFFSL